MSTVTTPRKATRQRPRPPQKTRNVDCCMLCDAPSEGSYRSDLAHLWRSHPDYARGLFLRMASPLVFIVSLLVLTIAKAPAWALVGAMAACGAIFGAGIVITRRERRVDGPSGAARALRLLREGGWRFIIIPVAGVSLILYGRR